MTTLSLQTPATVALYESLADAQKHWPVESRAHVAWRNELDRVMAESGVDEKAPPRFVAPPVGRLLLAEATLSALMDACAVMNQGDARRFLGEVTEGFRDVVWLLEDEVRGARRWSTTKHAVERLQERFYPGLTADEAVAVLRLFASDATAPARYHPREKRPRFVSPRDERIILVVRDGCIITVLAAEGAGVDEDAA
ncbi:MAG: hypothetical protein JNK72_24985 [Myxococcales bacterium]|nr:hypothetical protein [Myxococcales bacterium]